MNDAVRRLRVAVLVSTGRHPVSGVARWSRNDARALSLAFSLPPSQVSVDVIHAGSPEHPALPDYLALGVQNLRVIDTAPQTDIVPALAEHLHFADLLISGARAEGQQDSGMVPYLLAQQLHLSLVPSVLKLDISDTKVLAEQFLPKGRRRTIEVDVPTFLTVHPLAPLTLKYAHANKLAGSITPLQSGTPPVIDETWSLETVSARPIKLAARERRSGHARMLSATTTESRAGQIMEQGSTQEKAAALITYLREHGLIDY